MKKYSAISKPGNWLQKTELYLYWGQYQMRLRILDESKSRTYDAIYM